MERLSCFSMRLLVRSMENCLNHGLNGLAHVKTECNYGEGIELRAGQDAPPTVSVARFLNMSP